MGAFLEGGVYKMEAFISKIKNLFHLIGYAPLELSSLLYHFLNSDQKNFIRATVTGKRKREIGLVVSAKYDCYTKDKRTFSVLDEEIKKRKTKYKTLEIHHQKKYVYRKFPFKE